LQASSRGTAPKHRRLGISVIASKLRQLTAG
jgi:hypothetical protein